MLELVFFRRVFSGRALLLPAVLLLVAGVVACTKAVPAPQGAQPAALGISVVTRWSTLGFDVNPDYILFVRLAPAGGGAGGGALLQGEVFASNARAGNHFFLLNAPPGRYAAVAANEIVGVPSLGPSSSALGGWYPMGNPALGMARAHVTLFPRGLVDSTVVELAPGQFRFMGGYLVGRDVKISQVDPTQRHFRTFLVPAVEVQLYPQVAHLDLNVFPYRGTLRETHRDATAEKALLTAGLNGFGGAGWADLLRRRLAVLENGGAP